MDFLSIPVAFYRSFSFVASSADDTKTWNLLLAYCALQENGGVIAGAREWPHQIWPMSVGVTFEAVEGEHRLWMWKRNDLVINGYPVEMEARRQKASEDARAKAQLRWSKATASAVADAPAHAAALPLNADVEMPQQCVELGWVGLGRVESNVPPTPKGELSASASSKSTNGHGAKNGRKPRTATGRMPEEFAEPVRERMLRIGELFGRRAATPWSGEEVDAFTAQRLEALPTEDFRTDLEPLAAYYRLRLPEERNFKRRDLVTLLRHWPDDVNKARQRVAEEQLRRDPDGYERGGENSERIAEAMR